MSDDNKCIHQLQSEAAEEMLSAVEAILSSDHPQSQELAIISIRQYFLGHNEFYPIEVSEGVH